MRERPLHHLYCYLTLFGNRKVSLADSILAVEMAKRILLATNNRGKIAELLEMLSGLAAEIVGLSEFPEIVEVEETGASFAENARLKASGYAVQTGLPALADDSGLEIAALGGRPGVLSARYGGEGTTFGPKMEKLLREMDGLGLADRRSRFVSAMALADPTGKILFESQGTCTGILALKPKGLGGFGYDPLFIPDGFDQTFGQLPEAIKQKISHRADAFSQIIPFLRLFIAN